MTKRQSRSLLANFPGSEPNDIHEIRPLAAAPLVLAVLYFLYFGTNVALPLAWQ